MSIELTLEAVLARSIAPEVQSNPKALATLFQLTAKRDDGATILASAIQNDQNPLSVLDPVTATIPYLYILSVLSRNLEYRDSVAHFRAFECLMI